MVVLSGSSFLSDITQIITLGAELSVLFATHNPDDLGAFLTQADFVLIDNRQLTAGPELFRKINIPVLVAVSNAAEGFKMMQQGAGGMVLVSHIQGQPTPFTYRMLMGRIKDMLRLYHETQIRVAKHAGQRIHGKIIAIGASAGGTETILEVISQLPADAPPVLMVQHMPPVFTRLYAERANKQCAIEVWEARDGDKPANGLALLAPGDYHMILVKEEGEYVVRLQQGELVCGQRPAVDVLFNSVAETAGPNAIGVILTGMGQDGARGLRNMRRNGAYTIGQDEKTSAVYGMPRAAYHMGAVCVQLPLYEIAGEIMKHSLTGNVVDENKHEQQ
jgi:chemotaxis response regulator CheB